MSVLIHRWQSLGGKKQASVCCVLETVDTENWKLNIHEGRVHSWRIGTLHSP